LFGRDLCGLSPQSAPLSVNLEKEDNMTQVIPGESEGIESALRRFKREVSKAGIFQDMKKHRHFETPIEKSKRKALAKHKQRRKQFRF
jgi:small subunit ribosomal protein S21